MMEYLPLFILDVIIKGNISFFMNASFFFALLKKEGTISAKIIQSTSDREYST
jgi:hypothetical protein